MRFLKFIALALCLPFVLQAQSQWPREIQIADGGKVVIYEPQFESYDGIKLAARAAVQVKKTAKEEPIFGAIWAEATTQTNRDTRMLDLESIKITDVRFPDVTDSVQIQKLKTLLETEIPKWHHEISLDDLLSNLEEATFSTADGLKTTPPKIIYTTKPTTLVLIDGEPKVKKDEDMKMERVMNSPYLIVKEGGVFYLYANGFWYKSEEVLKGWKQTKSLPKKVKEINKQIKKQEEELTKGEQPKDVPKTPTEILVSTVPAELLQTNGEAEFKSVEGTSLLYASNTDNDIFKDINTQKNYVLLSGRWYAGSSLDGPWTYVAADKLPEDFSKIPEGSEKDGVLASVAGTQAAKEAILDAQVPQTAKVERKTATVKVEYDGEPKFEPIEGTSLYLAENSSVTVLRSGNKYYAVDNGIWFVSDNATGPWKVSDERPAEVDKIPASNAAYNTKYVYIYESTPEYVYVGYTPGYVGCYVFGPTIVYGTGFYYAPWWGTVYYPHPWTWGWSIHYNPWYGWSFGFGFHMSFCWHGGYYGGAYWGGGWYGPPMYRPPYHPGGWHGGYYGHRPVHYGARPGGGTAVVNPRPYNNMYNQRPGVSTKLPSQGYRPSTRPSQQPSTGLQPSTRPTTPSKEPNNLMTDKKGNIYQRDQNGNWNQRQDKSWKPSSGTSAEQLNKAQQQRDRGTTRQNNFNQGQRTKTAPRSAPARSGGGMRGGGGRRG